MKYNPLCVLPVLFVGIALSGCAPCMVREVEIGDKSRTNRILIATQQSEFKEAVVSKVVDALKNHAGYIKVIGLGKLAEESSEDYDAIAIINACMVWQLDPQASDFLDSVQEKEKVVLLTTAGGEGCRPEKAQVDAITSASKMSKVDRIAETLVNKVRAIMAQGNGFQGLRSLKDS